MKPWMILTSVAVLLVAAGIWLVWPQSSEIEAPVEPEEEMATEEPEPPEPPPVVVPALKAPPKPSVPEPARDQTEVLRALEEAAKNRQAVKDWDRQLVLECRRLINDRKYEEAQQCLQLRLARNPEEPAAYLERGILHARMGKRIDAYWDYMKYLELAPDAHDAPRIRVIVEQYEEFASGQRVPQPSDYDYKGEGLRMAKRLYEEAYILKTSNSEEALRRLRLALNLLDDDEQTYRGKAERLIERIKSETEDVQK